jgi:hypothetical protein
MIFDLDYAYAEKVYQALNGATATQVAIGFERALARKLGKLKDPAPDFDESAINIPAQIRFERFFDELFTVAPVDIDTPLSNEELRARFKEAHDTLISESERCAKSKKWRDVAESYKEDAFDYSTILDMMDREDVGRAISVWSNLDTAARDWMFTGKDEVRNRRTALALGYA